MNELMMTNTELTMSSQDIADLLGSRHDSVKRTIDRLIASKTIQLTPLVEVKNHLGQTVERYVFSGEQGKRDSIIVVAQLSPEFTARIVDRWIELESKSQFQIPTTLSEALQLAADQAKALEEAKPKIDYYNRVSINESLMNATQVAKKVNLSATSLNRYLVDLGVYSKSVKRSKVFNQWFIDEGYGEVKTTSNGFTQSVFTIKGEQYVIQLLTSEGII
ncbi:MAG: Rha family transcriptional regulator [Bacteroides sp.]